MSEKKPRKKHLDVKPLTDKQLYAAGARMYQCPGDCGRLTVETGGVQSLIIVI
jgi:hypothetical protein